MGAVAVFLLIACANVTNLMLARVGERRREFGVRAAIGAGRMRLARLALAESVLLALVAGGVGLVVAFGLLETFVTMAPPGLPVSPMPDRLARASPWLRCSSSSPGRPLGYGRRSPVTSAICTDFGRRPPRHRGHGRACDLRWSPRRSR